MFSPFRYSFLHVYMNSIGRWTIDYIYNMNRSIILEKCVFWNRKKIFYGERKRNNMFLHASRMRNNRFRRRQLDQTVPFDPMQGPTMYIPYSTWHLVVRPGLPGSAILYFAARAVKRRRVPAPWRCCCHQPPSNRSDPCNLTWMQLAHKQSNNQAIE